MFLWVLRSLTCSGRRPSPILSGMRRATTFSIGRGWRTRSTVARTPAIVLFGTTKGWLTCGRSGPRSGTRSGATSPTGPGPSGTPCPTGSRHTSGIGRDATTRWPWDLPPQQHVPETVETLFFIHHVCYSYSSSRSADRDSDSPGSSLSSSWSPSLRASTRASTAAGSCHSLSRFLFEFSGLAAGPCSNSCSGGWSGSWRNTSESDECSLLLHWDPSWLSTFSCCEWQSGRWPATPSMASGGAL